MPRFAPPYPLLILLLLAAAPSPAVAQYLGGTPGCLEGTLFDAPPPCCPPPTHSGAGLRSVDFSPRCCAPSTASRCCPGPKTLFEWSCCCDEPCQENGHFQSEAGWNNGNGGLTNGSNGLNGDQANGENGDEQEEEEPDTIVTDRPDFTEASSTVGLGRVQLELGYTYVYDHEAGTATKAHSYPETLLRVGIFAEWFEFRMAWNYLEEQTSDPFSRTRFEGAEDLSLGAKLALTEQCGALPEMALILQTTVPTGSDAFSDDGLLPGINWLYSWELSPLISVGGSTQGNRAKDDLGHAYLELAQSLTVAYSLTERWGAYTEWFAFFPHSAVDPEIGPEHYFNGGFTFLVTPDFQLDARAGVGLNDRADDYFLGTGAAMRF